MSDAAEVVLAGCRPEPLGSYLKALGILRLVSEQKDPDARGFWRGESFVLRSSLDRPALANFFRAEWCPTPVISPWNGGSGFYPKDNQIAANALLASHDPRVIVLAECIRSARSYVASAGWSERPAEEAKLTMISAMRASLPDPALAWLDAAVVLGDDRLLFPPLLGTGGNDGRLDFSNNFHQRVVQVLGDSTGLETALFGTAATSRFQGAMGQYVPAANDRTNPWDFVLLIEGAMVFAAAATRRLEGASASLAFPFHARASGGLATVVESDEKESRDELWLPLWSKPATYHSVRRLFAEGRATVGSGDNARPAATALEFARAVTALGVDRGIESFCRTGFHARNGLSYYATPLGRFATQDVSAARLLDDVDSWFDRFRYRTAGKNVPARLLLARRRLEQAMFEAVAGNSTLGSVLLDLGAAEQALAGSLAFTAKAFLSPVPRLQAAWVPAVLDGSIEQRLAASLASRPQIRSRLVPLGPGARTFGSRDDPSVVFGPGSLVDNLHALLQREDVEWQQGNGHPPPLAPNEFCSLTDIASFVAGETDDVLIERWLRAFVLIEGGAATSPSASGRLPSAAFALLALVWRRQLGALPFPRTAGALTLACAGDSAGATKLAIRRLGSLKREFPMQSIVEPTHRMRRIAAALAFPLTHRQYRVLERSVLPDIDEPFAYDIQEQA